MHKVYSCKAKSLCEACQKLSMFFQRNICEMLARWPVAYGFIGTLSVAKHLIPYVYYPSYDDKHVHICS